MSALTASELSAAEVGFEGGISYDRMMESLILILDHLPTHKEIMSWLIRYFRANDYGFHNFF